MKEKMSMWKTKTVVAVGKFMNDKSGNGLVDFLGSLIVGAVIVGLILVAVQAFIPGFIQDVFNKISRQLLS